MEAQNPIQKPDLFFHSIVQAKWRETQECDSVLVFGINKLYKSSHSDRLLWFRFLWHSKALLSVFAYCNLLVSPSLSRSLPLSIAIKCVFAVFGFYRIAHPQFAYSIYNLATIPFVCPVISVYIIFCVRSFPSALVPMVFLLQIERNCLMAWMRFFAIKCERLIVLW